MVITSGRRLRSLIADVREGMQYPGATSTADAVEALIAEAEMLLCELQLLQAEQPQ